MLEKDLQEVPEKVSHTERPLPNARQAEARWPKGLLCCAVGLVACVLLMVTPLVRIPDRVLTLHLAAGEFLAGASNWLPGHPGGLDRVTGAYSEFFSLLGLAFLCYGLGALLVRRFSGGENQRMARGLIWSGTLLAGTIFVVTPAMLSHDILVYASYSRLLAIYHANPYFVPISTFPHDYFAIYNYWSKTVAAYGPIWVLVCGAFGGLLRPDPEAYVLAFRIFALLFHLLNLWLVGRILQTMGRSTRTVTLGMLLYAWNPLLLLESGLGGHNDGFMMTFVLAGILLATSAEKRGLALHARGYLPAISMLTLAALVKFTALPILAVYLLFLGCKALRPTQESPLALRQALHNWPAALRVLAGASIAALLLTLTLYGPFWLGHDLTGIVASFKNPPSALYSENSFMRSVAEWQLIHPDAHTALLDLLGNRHLWDGLSLAGIVFCLLVGSTRLWRKPTTRTFVIVALATMSLVLLITPWFYAWYITWLLALGVICLPVRLNRVEAALLALVFVFSGSALLTYLFHGGLFGANTFLVGLCTMLPPACAFLLTLLLWRPGSFEKKGETKQ